MNDLVRVWKDEGYRRGLSPEEQAALPVNPAGEIELTEAELEAVSGAWAQDNKSQEVDQYAAATFNNRIISGEKVVGTASNSYHANNNKYSVSSEQSCKIQ